MVTIAPEAVMQSSIGGVGGGGAPSNEPYFHNIMILNVLTLLALVTSKRTQKHCSIQLHQQCEGVELGA